MTDDKGLELLQDLSEELRQEMYKERGRRLLCAIKEAREAMESIKKEMDEILETASRLETTEFKPSIKVSGEGDCNHIVDEYKQVMESTFTDAIKQHGVTKNDDGMTREEMKAIDARESVLDGECKNWILTAKVSESMMLRSWFYHSCGVHGKTRIVIEWDNDAKTGWRRIVREDDESLSTRVYQSAEKTHRNANPNH